MTPAPGQAGGPAAGRRRRAEVDFVGGGGVRSVADRGIGIVRPGGERPRRLRGSAPRHVGRAVVGPARRRAVVPAPERVVDVAPLEDHPRPADLVLDRLEVPDGRFRGPEGRRRARVQEVEEPGELARRISRIVGQGDAREIRRCAGRCVVGSESGPQDRDPRVGGPRDLRDRIEPARLVALDFEFAQKHLGGLEVPVGPRDREDDHFVPFGILRPAPELEEPPVGERAPRLAQDQVRRERPLRHAEGADLRHGLGPAVPALDGSAREHHSMDDEIGPAVQLGVADRDN